MGGRYSPFTTSSEFVVFNYQTNNLIFIFVYTIRKCTRHNELMKKTLDLNFWGGFHLSEVTLFNDDPKSIRSVLSELATKNGGDVREKNH